jgi:hypothetical protein
MDFPLDAKIKILSSLAADFVDLVVSHDLPEVPLTKTYTIESSDEGGVVKQAARIAAFEAFESSPIIKLAFDTRRIDQTSERNPRTNLQYWHRTDQFIEEGDEKNLKIFAKLARVMDDIKKRLGKEPEWFESYARQLYDQTNRILRVKEADLDIFRPQLSYLEQLIFARYRLSMNDLYKMAEKDIANRILSKDENLIGRAVYLKETKSSEDESIGKVVTGDMGKTTQESIVNAIFGGAGMRKDGEKSVSRTITITIRDDVMD